MGWEAFLAIVPGVLIALLTFYLSRRESKSSIIGNQSATIANQQARIEQLEAENTRMRDKLILLERRLGTALWELDQLKGKS